MILKINNIDISEFIKDLKFENKSIPFQINSYNNNKIDYFQDINEYKIKLILEDIEHSTFLKGLFFNSYKNYFHKSFVDIFKIFENEKSISLEFTNNISKLNCDNCIIKKLKLETLTKNDEKYIEFWFKGYIEIDLFIPIIINKIL